MSIARPAATLALGALVLAACDLPAEPPVPSVPDARFFVPIQTVLRETAGRPFECIDHDPASNSCIAIAQMRQSGATVRNIATTLIATDPEVRLNTIDRLRIVDGRLCGDPADSRIEVAGDLPAEEADLFREFVALGAASFGEICGAYYRDGDGYVFVTTDPSGAVIFELPPVRSDFFEAAPGLRLLPEF